jgi:hypothetical protein
MAWDKDTPNPGSDEAIEQGCTCAVSDNAHGRGFPWPHTDGLDPNQCPCFWTTEDCPLHGSVTMSLSECKGAE